MIEAVTSLGVCATVNQLKEDQVSKWISKRVHTATVVPHLPVPLFLQQQGSGLCQCAAVQY